MTEYPRLSSAGLRGAVAVAREQLGHPPKVAVSDAGQAAHDIAWQIANTYCDKSAAVYRLRNAIKRAILDERERCAHIALAIDSKRGNEKEIAKAIRARP